MGYFVQTAQCDECNRQQGRSPSGTNDLSLVDGRCGACRGFVQRPCVVCGGTVTSRQNVVFLGPVNAKHRTCGVLVKGKY